MRGYRPPGRSFLQNAPPPQPNVLSVEEVLAIIDDRAVAVMEQCQAMVSAAETRTSNLESIVGLQQGQLDKMREVNISVAKNVEKLMGASYTSSSQMRKLHVQQTVLHDCLLEAHALKSASLASREKVCEGLSDLAASLSGGPVDGSADIVAIRQYCGDGGAGLAHLGAASRMFDGLRQALAAARPPKEISSADRLSVELDNDVIWARASAFEPAKSVLDRWADSHTVQSTLGRFGVGGVMGGGDEIRYGDVLKLFQQIGLSTERFVNKFTCLQRRRSSKEEQDLAHGILKKFTIHTTRRPDAMRSKDLYRVFEILGYTLRKFKSFITGVDEPENSAPQQDQRFDVFRVKRLLDQTMKGVCCFLGEHIADHTKVAIKYPVSKTEVGIFSELQSQGSSAGLGIPKMLKNGTKDGEPFIVMELLGTSLGKLFEMLGDQPVAKRWRAMCILGRLLVRRLRAFHQSGFVHCDISPENILLKDRNDGQEGSHCIKPYLIDFEHATKCTDGKKLGFDCGSAEWSSVRSAEGMEPLPEDDLEALGWVLMHGVCGPLPWFTWLTDAYKDWSESPWTRQQVVRQVQRAKVRLLDEGWRSLGCQKSFAVPGDLVRFIRACRPGGEAGQTTGQPDYSVLLALLGGEAEDSSAKTEEADQNDVNLLSDIVAPLL